MVDREEWLAEHPSAYETDTHADTIASLDYVDAIDINPRGAKAVPKPVKKAKTRSSAVVTDKQSIIGDSPVMKRLRDDIALFADEIEPVLICGETGSGKEAVAREVHRQSSRSDKPFVVRNVSGVSPELAGSEFFGHVKGAFTGAIERRDGVFALADGGSLHLDEIGDLSLGVQSQILRVLEDGVITPIGGVMSKSVNTRVIAATNVELTDAVAKNTFREDLYHRLNVLRIDVPPLRDRGDDVIAIAEFWLGERGKKRGATAKLSNGAADRLRAHHWPGNVRELKNTVIRGAILARDGKISDEHIRLDAEEKCSRSEGLNIAEGKELVARYLAAKALDQTGGNATKAAKLTSLGRTSFMSLKQQLPSESGASASLAAELRAFLGIC